MIPGNHHREQQRFGSSPIPEVRTSGSGYRIVQQYRIPLPKSDRLAPSASPLGIAVDIGTTTIAMELVDRVSGNVLAGYSLLNSQRRWGSDVISRIRAANDGQLENLNSAVHKNILEGCFSLMQQAGVAGSSVGFMTVAANTVMAHLFLGLPCTGMAQSPFSPEKTEFPEVLFYDLFKTELSVHLPAAECRVLVLPALSAFIGGDVVGALAVLDQSGMEDFSDAPGFPVRQGFPSPEGTRLFIDLGTNAEMVLSYQGKHYCASAAAGPAFEGGAISCGTGCIPGAVSSVVMEGSRLAYDVIPGGEPDRLTGICGSGILDFTACALENGLVNSDGSLAPVCAESGIRLDPGGQIILTQQDVREIQLAKAAVRAGIAVLLETAGIREDSVSSIMIAGGFGLYLREQSALVTGLLPAAFAGKTTSPGNTSLAAAVARLLDEGMDRFVRAFIQNAESVVLADYPGFEEFFISGINF